MPQSVPPGGAGLGLGAIGQQGGADPNAAAAAGQGQGQWPAGDPNSYYSNYWGGQSFEQLKKISASIAHSPIFIGYYGQQPGQQGGVDGQHQGGV